MPNTKSAEKAVRSSARKKANNLNWKRRIRAATKSIKDSISSKEATADILKTQLSALQKVADKAAKENVFHKNKAVRIKSKYAQKITAHLNKAQKPSTRSKVTKK